MRLRPGAAARCTACHGVRSQPVLVALVLRFTDSDTPGRLLLRWRCQGLSLLHNIGDQNSGLSVARLTPRVWRLGGYLEGIACFDCAGRLTLYGKLEATFQGTLA